MNKLLLQKLQASTLPEVLISMVVMMIIFGLAMAIYARVTTSGYSTTSQQVQLEMQKIIRESITKQDFNENVLMQDSIQYQKTVRPYPPYADLVNIEIKATAEGKLLGTLQQVVQKEEQ